MTEQQMRGLRHKAQDAIDSHWSEPPEAGAKALHCWHGKRGRPIFYRSMAGNA